MTLLALLLACQNERVDTTTPPPPDPTATPPAWPALVPGAPLVGAAEGWLELPIGTPLGGYTARCECMLGFSRQDARDSAYVDGFVPSTGVQTLPGIKVIWLSNGDEHLVLTKTDSIYSFDGLVDALTQQLELATGLDLDGRVIHTANHSHGSFGTFSDATTFYLGSDRFHRENFQRMVDQMTEVALAAHGRLEPGRIGVGWEKDWDPAGEIYSDRRGENDTLAVWPDAEPGMGKDPHLGLIRFDDADGNLVAAVVNFGMHGIIGSESNPMVTIDSGGHLEAWLEEAWDHPVVVMFAQGAGGDASPRGRDDDFAAMESIGELATDRIVAALDATATSDAPISLETVSRHIPQDLETIQVTRDGTVDWRYAPYEEGRVADDVIYEPDGSIASPIDEFNAPYGALFCASGFPLPAVGLNTEAPEYEKCIRVDGIAGIVELFFTIDSFPLPLPESLGAGTTVSRVGPLPTRLPDGRLVEQDLLVGFFPGEATAMYTEQWRRRVKAELGDEQAMMISYAQDHEGYLTIPEDWLMGGYEADIFLWGPLGGEHVMEGVLQAADELLSTPVREDPDPDGIYASTLYADKPFERHVLDTTPRAGTRFDAPPAVLWTPFHPDGVVPLWELIVPDQVPRVQGLVQLAWEGGDPAVDLPRVIVQRLEGDVWVNVTSANGRVIDTSAHDILLGHTPNPLEPFDAVQEHRYWAAWQAVGHVHDKAALPLGTYRLHVEGKRFVGTEEVWPFTTEPYTVDSEPFELVPAVVTVEAVEGGLTLSLAAPELGYRMVHIDGASKGDNPVVGEVSALLTLSDATTRTEALTPRLDGQRSRIDLDLTDVVSVEITDAAGNVGTWSP